LAADFLLLEGGAFDGMQLLLESDVSGLDSLVLESSPDLDNPSAGGSIYRPTFVPRRR